MIKGYCNGQEDPKKVKVEEVCSSDQTLMLHICGETPNRLVFSFVCGSGLKFLWLPECQMMTDCSSQDTFFLPISLQAAGETSRRQTDKWTTRRT